MQVRLFRGLILAIVPLVCAPGSVNGQSGTFFVEGDRVGVGTPTPTDTFHIVSSDEPSADGGQLFIENTSVTSSTRSMLRLKNHGRLVLRLTDTALANTWNFVSGGVSNEFIISENSTGLVEMGLDSGGNLDIRGTLTTGGPQCGGGCDRVFESDFALESIEDHAERMWSAGYLPAVGPTSPNAPFNVTEKTGGMLNELEKAHIYIHRLHEEIKELRNRLAQKEAEVDERIARLERALLRTP